MWINFVDQFYAALKIQNVVQWKFKCKLNGILTILPINENLIKVVLLIFKENKQEDSCLY